jgi:hypothetical protein
VSSISSNAKYFDTWIKFIIIIIIIKSTRSIWLLWTLSFNLCQEMMMRGPPPGKNDAKGTMGSTMSRSKSPQMTAFSLHGGPVPHPPQR